MYLFIDKNGAKTREAAKLSNFRQNEAEGYLLKTQKINMEIEYNYLILNEFI